ncbi:MAG: hypothetical protein ACLR9T_06385 [Thomasclavelia sp.]|uniref:hypothetical protein n=1 Tax=Thomasclavelia sp. TaxID=3025757 RepID=UPI00399FEDEF
MSTEEENNLKIIEDIKGSVQRCDDCCNESTCLIETEIGYLCPKCFNDFIERE